MATPVFITGFEHQVLSVQGAALFNNIVGSEITIDNTVARTGAASLKIATTGSASSNVRRTILAGTQIYVLSGYIRLGSGGFPSATSIFFGTQSTTGSIFNGIALTSTGLIQCRAGSGPTTVSSAITMVANQWYLVDLRITQNSTTWTVDWAIDGVAQTQVSATGQTAGDIGSIRIGTNTNAITLTGWVDDVIGSATTGDYPIGAHAVELLKPVSDGTHNAGTNTMENQAGADLGTAWSLLDDIPMSSASEYVKQSTIGTGNYAEVIFGTIQAAVDSIIGAMAILAYTSSSTASNSGGAIITKDNFSSNTPIHGVAGTLADYSDGSTSDVYYKNVIIAGLDTLAEANAIKARIGYSGDITPNPYWVNLAVEVAYVASATTSLDLVTYSLPVKDITIIDHEPIPLALVSYSLPVKDITVLENELITLALVSYSLPVKDITIIEHELVTLALVSYSLPVKDITIVETEIILLDLVAHSLPVKDLTILENELVALDLVSYSLPIKDIAILENEVVLLDLINYSIPINSISLLESELVHLDLVSGLSAVNDIGILEHEITDLDLVSYSVSINDLEILEDGVIGLDCVLFSSTINELTILDNENISLDLVSYIQSVNDLALVEHEVVYLDLVSYSMSIFDLTVMETETISLNLVSYVSTVNPLTILESEIIDLDLVLLVNSFENLTVVQTDVIFLDLVEFAYSINNIMFNPSDMIVSTPLSRCYLIGEEVRVIAIKKEERVVTIEHEERTILIY